MTIGVGEGVADPDGGATGEGIMAWSGNVQGCGICNASLG